MSINRLLLSIFLLSTIPISVFGQDRWTIYSWVPGVAEVDENSRNEMIESTDSWLHALLPYQPVFQADLELIKTHGVSLEALEGAIAQLPDEATVEMVTKLNMDNCPVLESLDNRQEFIPITENVTSHMSMLFRRHNIVPEVMIIGCWVRTIRN